MTLTEKFINDAIHIDASAEVMYGSDAVFDTYPTRFATVEFQLMATDALVEIADRISIGIQCPASALNVSSPSVRLS